MRIRQGSIVALLGLAIIALPMPPVQAAAMSRPVVGQVTDPAPGVPPDPAPPVGAAYTDISPDGTCASGFTAFVVARGVRECYTPDPVVENENLQGTCPTDPSLFICPGDED